MHSPGLHSSFFSGFNTAIYAIIPDCVEYGEWKTGLRNDGFQYAFVSLGNKIGMAIGTALLAALLGKYGYVANQAQNPKVIAIMKHASVINDTVMERVANFIKEGMTEKEVADFIDAEYLKEGASGVSFDTIVCFGPNAADQHHTPSETRTLKAGECVLIDMGCVWKGYCSDMTRTFYCKSVDDEQAAIHDLVRTAVEKAEAVIKPGMRFCDIDAQARDLIDEAGYSEYWRIRLGHFIGQEDHEVW